jgi:DNA end-binding protein Ku
MCFGWKRASEGEQISFNQLNRKTGHRIKYLKLDADTGEEVANEGIVKGYMLDKETFAEVSKEELEEVASEPTRTIDIDEFVDREEIYPRYLIRPYYIRPDGKIGSRRLRGNPRDHPRNEQGAIARVILTNRGHISALAPPDKGLVGTLLRYPYEVRSENEYFDEIQDVKVTKDMLDLAKHIVNQKSGSFEPNKFEDQDETALIDLINQKRAGQPITPEERPRAAAGTKAAGPAKKPRKVAAGKKEMLMPIAGMEQANETMAKKPTTRQQRRSA